MTRKPSKFPPASSEESPKLSATPREMRKVEIRDRAGWWREGEAGEREYLLTPAGLRDATKGFDFQRVLAVLCEKGVIPPAGSDGKSSRPEWVPDEKDGKRRKRMYTVNVAKLEELIDGA